MKTPTSPASSSRVHGGRRAAVRGEVALLHSAGYKGSALDPRSPWPPGFSAIDRSSMATTDALQAPPLAARGLAANAEQRRAASVRRNGHGAVPTTGVTGE